jgi:hypothetical protein
MLTVMSSKENEKRPDLNVIVELLDNEGYTNKELAEKTFDHESHISKYVKKFRTDRILHRDGDLDVYIGPRDNAKPEEKLNAFQYILKSFFTEPRWESTMQLDTTKKLLASKYVNSLISAHGLRPIYEILEEYMKQEEFRSIASQTLLRQPALIEEYTIKLPLSMEKYMELYRNDLFEELKYRDETKYLLKFLFRLDEIGSIKFHRQYLAERFGKLYRILTQRDVPITRDDFVTEVIRKFLELDLFLSPFTSFPMYFPVELLFGRPFERLYTDFYICNQEDIKKLILRAHIVYSNFIGVVSAGVVNSGIYVTDLEILLKQYISSWNIASRYLDHIIDSGVLEQNESSSRTPMYHIYSGTTGLDIMDLANKKLLSSSGVRYEMNRNYPTIDLDDPAKEIRICYCFEETGLETEKVSYEDALAGIRSKIKNATVVEEDRRLAYGKGRRNGYDAETRKSTTTFTLHGEVVFEVSDEESFHFNEEKSRKYVKRTLQFFDDQKRQDGHD